MLSFLVRQALAGRLISGRVGCRAALQRGLSRGYPGQQSGERSNGAEANWQGQEILPHDYPRSSHAIGVENRAQRGPAGEGGAPLSRGRNSLPSVALSAQMRRQPLGSVGKETARYSISRKSGGARMAHLKQELVESEGDTLTKGRANELRRKWLMV